MQKLKNVVCRRERNKECRKTQIVGYTNDVREQCNIISAGRYL